MRGQHGYLVDVAAVEAALRAHPAVAHAAVAVDGEQVVARVRARGGVREVDLAALARSRLPDYMVPSRFVILGGEPAAEAPPTDDVADICRELLGLDTVAPDDNFFALGGHSMLVARLVDRLEQRFGVEVPVTAVFDDPTVAGIARTVERARATAGGQP